MLYVYLFISFLGTKINYLINTITILIYRKSTNTINLNTYHQTKVITFNDLL